MLISFRPGENPGAWTLGYGTTYTFKDGAQKTADYAEIYLGPTYYGTPWDPTNTQWVIMHEMGHGIGLSDLYPEAFQNDPAKTPEEFIDHPVAGNALPDPGGKSDNIMAVYRGIVDNDEIAGLTWLWGASRNQIVTGDLEATWTRISDYFFYRKDETHHGDQINPSTLGWWDYRGSIVSAGAGNPYVDVEFPGYLTYTSGELYPSPGVTGGAWKYVGNQGGDIERFEITQPGWTGNFVLELKSKFEEERRVRAWVVGGRTDNFILPINTAGLVFDGRNNWPVVFGPMGPDKKDFGDAPDSYKTLLTSDGPRYQEGEYQRLGYRWDMEPDGQPTPWAIGDDINLWGIGGPDDEDGIIFGDRWVDVILSINRPGLWDYWLDAWWDLNWNGFFDHPTERSIHDLLTLDIGTYNFRYFLGFDPLDYFSRFRLTWVDDPLSTMGGVTLLTDITPWGEFLGADGISHGEVEDYGIPEPSTLLLLGSGLVVIFVFGRKRLFKKS